MNQDLPTNNLSFEPTPKTEQMTNEIMSTSLADLKAKHKGDQLFQLLFSFDENYFNVSNNLAFKRHDLICEFWKSREPVNLTSEERDKIARSIFEAKDASQLGSELTKINKNLQVPKNIKLAEAKQTANNILLGYENITSVLVDNVAEEYLMDTIHFYRMNDNDLKALEIKIDEVSTQISDKFSKQGKNGSYQLSENFFQESIEILTKLGRTRLSLNDILENRDVRAIAEIFSKFDISLKVAWTLKSMKLDNTQDIHSAALSEIKKAILPTLDLNKI